MFIFGVIMVVIGATMVWKTEGYLKTFGQITWAEANMQGGSISFYNLLGVLFCFIGLLAVTGLFKGFIMWLLTPLFGSLAG